MENINNRNRPIAVIDSGMGGLSVLRVLREILPCENYIYFGDSANAPYGEKTGDEVMAITDKNIAMLSEMGAKAVVIACNTATSVAAKELRERYKGIPIIGMEPAIKPAAMCAPHPTVLVMATPLTLKREKFLSLLSKYEDKADFINVPCHGLVELVEKGIVDGEEMDKCLDCILTPYQGEKTIDAVVLGCTHYIHAKESIRKKLGAHVTVFDGALGTARETERRLLEAGLLNTSDEKGTLTVLNSSSDPRLADISERLLK